MCLTDSFLTRVKAYENTEEHNDNLHTEFSKLSKTIPFLSQHRNHVETNQLGFGDAAFHYMWYLLIQHISKNSSNPNVLEIGVFKGQVISLWKLIALQLNLELSITGISPLKGNPLPESKWTRRWNSLVSSRFRKELESRNFYPEEDYRAIIGELFETFNLQFSEVRLIEGYSNNSQVIKAVANKSFSIIYIDGDHTFEGASKDIKNYSSLVDLNGLLIMDDASYYIPGSSFWKGHETVSRACEIIPSLGFTNVLNVGHNRIYQRVK